MKRYRSKATRSQVSLSSLHRNCLCVSKDCLKLGKDCRKTKKVVLLLWGDAECLYCDLCVVFKKIRNEKKNPDYVIYIDVKGYEPQWVVVDAKQRLKNDYGVAQIKKGLEAMREKPEMFEVRPLAVHLLGLLVHNRKEVRTSNYALSRNYTLEYRGLTGKVQLHEYGKPIEKYLTRSEG